MLLQSFQDVQHVDIFMQYLLNYVGPCPFLSPLRNEVCMVSEVVCVKPYSISLFVLHISPMLISLLLVSTSDTHDDFLLCHSLCLFSRVEPGSNFITLSNSNQVNWPKWIKIMSHLELCIVQRLILECIITKLCYRQPLDSIRIVA